MRIKILLLGENPVALESDIQLLRERGLLVITAYNLDNTRELINEIKPDIIFFDAYLASHKITDVYNEVITGTFFANIPVIFTLAEDDIYLVTRKRTETNSKTNLIADNMIDAIKMALEAKRYSPAQNQGHKTRYSGTKPGGHTPGAQLRMPFY